MENILETYGINMDKDIEISVFLSEVVDTNERYVVREYSEDRKRALRTKLVATREEAEQVKQQWLKS